jgi:3-hydroxybutyryl-CoA dehydrogenase
MRLVVLATTELREELLSQPVHDDIEIEWLETPVDLQKDASVDACIDLLFDNKPERIDWLRQIGSAIIVINSVIVTLEEIGQDFIRINGWKSFLNRSLMEATCRKDSQKRATEVLFSKLGRNTEWVPDIPGLITPRVVASIINEAFMTLEEQVSTESEIDIAMKLGTNYPFGPFEWGQKIGLLPVYNLLQVLSEKKNRYKPSNLLKARILV